MAIGRYYDEAKNPGGIASFPGVPLRDIEQAEFDEYPAWLQRSIDASEMYRKTNPNPTPRKTDARKDDD